MKGKGGREWLACSKHWLRVELKGGGRSVHGHLLYQVNYRVVFFLNAFKVVLWFGEQLTLATCTY